MKRESNSTIDLKMIQYKSRLSKILAFALAIFPCVLIGILITINAVNIPFWDQWGIAPLFEKFQTGTLTFNDLIAQHNESRKFFPRLIFLALGFLTRWDVRYEMLVIFVLACLTSINIYYLNGLTISGGTIKKLLIAAIANFLIFSPIQWENLLWGIQIVVFIPLACLTTCIALAYSNLGVNLKFLICICLCTFSTYSYANGMLCWLLILPILLLKYRQQLKLLKLKLLTLSYLLAFVTNVGIYFHNYLKPSHHPAFSYALKHPLQTTHYFLSFLGAPLAFGSTVDSLTISTILGFIIFTIFLATLIFLSKTLILLDYMVSWLAIAMYAIISGLVTTIGRVGFGVEQSLNSRYTTFSVYLIIALVHMLVIISDDIKNKPPVSKLNSIFLKSLSPLLAVIFTLHFQTSLDAINKMNEVKVSRLQVKSCILMINVAKDEEFIKTKVYPEIDSVEKLANSLNNLGFLRPGLVKNQNIKKIQGNNETDKKRYGNFDEIIQIAPTKYSVSGWAFLPHSKRSADSVILTYDGKQGTSNIFAIIENTRNRRDDVGKVLNNSLYIRTGWQKNISINNNNFPQGKVTINSWAFDTDTGKAFKLNGSHIISN